MNIRTIIFRVVFLLPTVNLFSQSAVTDSLKKLLVKAYSSAERLEIELQLAENYKTQNPDTSLFYAKKAWSLSQEQNEPVKMIRAEFYMASYDYLMGKPENALTLSEKNMTALQKRPEQISLLAQYTSFSGLCLMKLNRIKEAVERFYAALKLAEQCNDYFTQLRARVNIGWAMMELNQHAQAVTNFKNALRLMDERNLSRLNNGIIYNNLAASYGELNQLDSSLKYSTLGIAEARKTGNIGAEANGLFILGTAQVREDKYNEALQSFLSAKPLREKIGDPFYIVSDMAEMANLYVKLNKPQEGIAVSKEALKIAIENKIDAKLPLIYSALATNYESAGNYKEATEVYKKINELKDSVYADANPKALAEMQTKYETEKKELQIQQQKFHIAKQNFLIGGVIGLLILGSFLGYSQYRRYKFKQEAKMKTVLIKQQQLSTRAVLEAEEKERQRIAKDLHDGIGQMMSAAKMNLSAFESEIKFEDKEQQLAFEKIIQLVDESCKEVRNVSHNMMPNALLKSSLSSAIREFIDKLDHKKLQVHLYAEGLDERLDSNTETVFYRVIQECVNNVIKHAEATTLDISLIKDKEGISATIEDNGIGFSISDKEKFKGMGLKNIITRIEYLKGTVDFDSTPGKGTLVALHVPLNH
ncbi:MAG TPA: histidine kinase [Chitinophagaceae bacterium]|jgi:signal transduction histidine kinase|nr:histidine kinase [Chitinophagaceae bacterium]